MCSVISAGRGGSAAGFFAQDHGALSPGRLGNTNTCYFLLCWAGNLFKDFDPRALQTTEIQVDS